MSKAVLEGEGDNGEISLPLDITDSPAIEPTIDEMGETKIKKGLMIEEEKISIPMNASLKDLKEDDDHLRVIEEGTSLYIPKKATAKGSDEKQMDVDVDIDNTTKDKKKDSKSSD